jgi:hypothetical protein
MTKREIAWTILRRTKRERFKLFLFLSS